MFKIGLDGDAGIDCFSDPKSTQLGVGPNIDLVDFGSGLWIGVCRLLGEDKAIAAVGDVVVVEDGVEVGVGVEIICGIGLRWGKLMRGSWRCGLETNCWDLGRDLIADLRKTSALETFARMSPLGGDVRIDEESSFGVFVRSAGAESVVCPRRDFLETAKS